MNEEIHIAPVHPGLVLQDELEEIGVTQAALANHIGVSPKLSMKFVAESAA